MNKLDQEWLSAAVDGELDDQAIDLLSSDKNAQQQWQRYHVIGDAIRDELPESMSLNLSENIAAALENEITYTQTVAIETASLAGAANNASWTDNVVPMFKQFGQYAIAASVAVFAVVGVQNYQQFGSESNPISVLDTRPLAGTVSPVSLQTGPSQAQLTQQEYNNKLNEQRRRINAYIQDHMLQQRLNIGAEMQKQTSASKPQQ
ncbi:MAG: sigma-E factor negative regulatory protein [Parashewanella sp.]